MEEITSQFPNFDPDNFVEQTAKIQEIISDSRFESWMEIWIISQSCQEEISSGQVSY